MHTNDSQTKFKAMMLKTNLYDYFDGYILDKGTC